ncbi:hypothetical protein L289_1746 [Acinetobacter gerneri DSM 14967 = CIP 107464 = MTCC 9824]|nr:hypothetical protein L289_1746 [Acinetobacter gerneri DSM 14967 = CIP 107464 = MTCC 9824]
MGIHPEQFLKHCFKKCGTPLFDERHPALIANFITFEAK